MITPKNAQKIGPTPNITLLLQLWSSAAMADASTADALLMVSQGLPAVVPQGLTVVAHGLLVVGVEEIATVGTPRVTVIPSTTSCVGIAAATAPESICITKEEMIASEASKSTPATILTAFTPPGSIVESTVVLTADSGVPARSAVVVLTSAASCTSIFLMKL